MKAIYQKELQGFFCTMLGYVYIAFTLLIIGIFFTAFHLQGGRAEFSYSLSTLTMVLLIVIPMLTMRALGEERRQKTDQILFTSAVTTTQIVLGKYFAILTVFSIPILVAALCPLVLARYGPVPLAETYACFLPFLLMGAACIAVGIFLSSFTESAIVCAVETFGVLFLSYLMKPISTLIEKTPAASAAGFAAVVIFFWLAMLYVSRARNLCLVMLAGSEAVLCGVYLVKKELFAKALPEFLLNLSLFSRFEDFADGVFSLVHLVYYLSVIVLFLYLTVQSLEIRRWS